MSVAISMVAFGTTKISGSGIVKAWQQRWPNSTLPTDPSKKDNTLSYRVGNLQVVYGLMPAPIPWSDLEGPCQTSALWPDAATAMRQHQKHVVVTVMGQADRIQQFKVLTQATCALVESGEGAIGVYWGDSAQVFEAKSFCNIAAEYLPDRIPILIWVDVRTVVNADGSCAGFTHGLSSFGQKEFECTICPEPPEELERRFLGLAEYVIEHGAVNKDGDTIGQDANEKIKVRIQKSQFGIPGEVLRLEYPNSTEGMKMTTYGKIHRVGTLLCTLAMGYLLYAFAPILRESFFRHFVFIPATLVFGFVFLTVSDRMLNKAFGLEVFAKPK